MKMIYQRYFDIRLKSINSAYSIGTNKYTGKSFLFKKNKYADSFSEIEFDIFTMHKKILGKIDLNTEMFFITYYEFMPNFFNKNGTVNKKRGDSDRFLKGAKDALFKGLGIDDCHCLGEKVWQLPSDDEKILIEIHKVKIPKKGQR